MGSRNKSSAKLEVGRFKGDLLKSGLRFLLGFLSIHLTVGAFLQLMALDSDYTYLMRVPTVMAFGYAGAFFGGAYNNIVSSVCVAGLVIGAAAIIWRKLRGAQRGFWIGVIGIVWMTHGLFVLSDLELFYFPEPRIRLDRL